MSHEQFKDVIDALYKCATDCIHCEVACLEEDNVKGLVQCIKLDRECSETCIFAAKMLASDPEMSTDILNLCASICDLCATECEKHAGHMEHCKVCAESCRECAEACRSTVSLVS
ncbi:MAG TPA: four-helix bundle copper-binding protein [Bacteroidales bacterium]|nr:four-helix bundle copper-binding protein [Bacteroidales bacterium]